MSGKFLVSLGTYERIVYGIDFEMKNDELSSKAAFAIPAHTGYVKSIASCPKYLVSGGTDEVIRIFDLKRRKDIGSINQHEGSITSLSLYSSSHLMSAAEDGKLALFRTRDWECLHIFQKHKKPIQSMSIHPSGKLAVAIDFERNFTLWNLVTGKMAHFSKVPGVRPFDKIIWSASGKFYALISQVQIIITEAQMSKKIVDLRADSRGSSFNSDKWLTGTFVNDEYFLFAGEGEGINFISIESKERRVILSSHKPRIRSLLFYSAESGSDLIISASSDGLVKLWWWKDFLTATIGEHGPKPVCEHESQLRITCMTVTRQ